MGNFFREELFFPSIRVRVYNRGVKQDQNKSSIFNAFIKFAFILGLLGFLSSCQSERGPSASAGNVVSKAVDWAQGDCIDTPLSPYVYQISAIEGDQVYLYKLGEMGKKVVIKSIAKLRGGEEPFQKIPCP